MFHNRHQLNRVVSQFLDAGECVAGELWICANTVFACRDPDVSLVDPRTPWGRRGRVFEFVALFFRGVPKSGVIGGGDVEILSDTADPSGYSFDTLPRRSDHRDLHDVKPDLEE